MSSVVSAVTKVAEAAAPFVPGYGTIASLAFQGYSMMQQRKQGKKAASAERERAAIDRKKQEDQQKMSQVQAQRARVAEQRKARIAAGRILASGSNAGLGMTGSSVLSGALGSVSSQLGLNVGNINVGQDFAEGQTQQNMAMGDLQSQTSLAQAKQTGWQSMGTMFSNLSTSYGNPFDTGVKETKQAPQNYPTY